MLAWDGPDAVPDVGEETCAFVEHTGGPACGASEDLVAYDDGVGGPRVVCVSHRDEIERVRAENRKRRWP